MRRFQSQDYMAFDDLHRPVAAIRPAAPYIGGKKLLAARICALIATMPHQTYAEAFVGMGGVFLRRKVAARSEVINDLNGDVATFFRILQRHYPQFIEVLRFQITSRREFERLKASDPATLTDLERAARFLYLQRLAFGGKVAGRNFGVSVGAAGRFDMSRLATMLEDIHERLAGVVIESLPWQEFLYRYDRPETLFYLDPPYWGSEGDYGEGLFGGADFEAMTTALSGLQGRFIMSINDVPPIRELFGRFDIQPVELTYSLAGGQRTPARELIITGGGRDSAAK